MKCYVSSSSSSSNDNNFLSFTFFEFDFKDFVEFFFFLAEPTFKSEAVSFDLFSGFLKVIFPSAGGSSEQKEISKIKKGFYKYYTDWFEYQQT